MGEMKPTPGEWVVESDDEGLGVVAYIGGIGYWVTSVIRDAGPDSTEATNEANARLIAEAGTVFHNTGLSPVQLVEMVKELKEALTGAQQAINSMKVEAETAAQGDEQMMLEACETISNEGLDADMAIRAALAKCEGVK